jgi:hypothetical protein
MRIDGVRFYERRTLLVQIVKLKRRYDKALTGVNKGRIKHIARQIKRVDKLVRSRYCTEH